MVCQEEQQKHSESEIKSAHTRPYSGKMVAAAPQVNRPIVTGGKREKWRVENVVRGCVQELYTFCCQRTVDTIG